MLLVLLAIGCGGPKQPTQAELSEEYDYRTALQNYRLGINSLNNDDVVGAIRQLETAVRLDPNNFRYHHGLGLALSLNGQLEDAIQELKKAVTINPTDTESYNLMGSIYTDMKRYDDAIDSLRHVIRDNAYPQPEFPFYNLAVCYQRQGRLTEAVAAYKRATELNDQFYRAFFALGRLYKDQKDYGNALYHFKKAEPGLGSEVELLYEIGRANFMLKNFDEAKSYLAQVSILFPPPAIDEPTQEMLRYIEEFQRKGSD
jgi:type IV pilus biogenesis/stability protein PilW